MSLNNTTLSLQERNALLRKLAETKIDPKKSFRLSDETSHAEQRMWILNQSIPNPEAYNICVKLNINGPLDAPALSYSLNTLINQHQILKSNYEYKNAKLYRTTNKKPLDLTYITYSDSKVELSQLIKQHSSYLFDLYKDPLLKTVILSKTSTQHTLLFIFHHIIIDGWSIGIFLKDFETLYNTNALQASLPTPYSLYIDEEKTYLKTTPLFSKKWLSNYKKDTEPLSLQPNKSQNTSFKSKTHTHIVTEKTKTQLSAYCKEHKCTPFMFMLSIYILCLHQYTKRNQFCIGVPLANRTNSKFESTVGLFVNTLPIAVSLSNIESFPSILAQVKESVLFTFSMQQFPFNEIINQLNIERKEANNPLFNCFFAYQNETFPHISLKNTQTTLCHHTPEHSPFEFNLECFDTQNSINLLLHYHSNTYTLDFIKQWVHSFNYILNNVLSEKSLSINELTPPKSYNPPSFELTPMQPAKKACSKSIQTTSLKVSHQTLSKHCGTYKTKPTSIIGSLLAHYLSTNYSQDSISIGINSTQRKQLLFTNNKKSYQELFNSFNNALTKQKSLETLIISENNTPNITLENCLYVTLSTNTLLNIELCILSDWDYSETLKDWAAQLKFMLSSNTFPECTENLIPLRPDITTFLSTINNTKTPLPTPLFIHEQFIQQTHKTPLKKALTLENKSLNYKELLQHCYKTASYLQSQGIQPGMSVGIYTHRSFDRVISFLSLLMTGATCVPIDTEIPKKRIEHIIEDTQLHFILTSTNIDLPIDIKDTETLTTVSIQDILENISNNSFSPPSLKPDSIAYIMYTSGTSGQPKGSLIKHNSLSNRIQSMKETYAIKTTDKILHKTVCSFDISIWELCLPVISGAEMIILPPALHKNPASIIHQIQKHTVTIAHFVPSIFDIVLESPEVSNCVSLRHIFCSGEALLPSVIQKSYTLLPKATCHNLYGPTEATIEVCAYTCKKMDSLIPIGKPIDNTQLHVVNHKKKPIHPGYVGQLFISGICLSKGYLNHPELTKKAFTALPSAPGKKWYKTGDLATWLPCGNLHYIGRNDSQVKIFGIRIECQEISSQLNQHKDIKHAHVLYHKNKLVAFYCPKTPLKKESLIEHLQEHLPTYMIPSQFYKIEDIPLTQNQKIDLEKLRNFIQEPQKTTSPTTDTEKAVTALWQTVLLNPCPCIHQSFFNYGGNSLKLFELHIQLNKQFNPTFTLSDLYQFQTIYQLAKHIDSLE